jgi:hypothetical protein
MKESCFKKDLKNPKIYFGIRASNQILFKNNLSHHTPMGFGKFVVGLFIVRLFWFGVKLLSVFMG